jgi:hypothetical protein
MKAKKIKDILSGCVIVLSIFVVTFYSARYIEDRNKKHKEADSIWNNMLITLKNTSKMQDSIISILDGTCNKLEKTKEILNKR